MRSFRVHDLGRMPYEVALEKQEELFQQILDHKKKGEAHALDTLLLVEHDPVYTLGKSGDLKNLKRQPGEVGASFFKTNRGGDITYHGPGQIVAYPIFDLEHFEIGIAAYIWRLEQAVINVLKNWNIEAGRIPTASGVWLDADGADPRKICAIGVKASRYVTMHGLAFNVNTDLAYFEHIVPCGIDDKGVTSLSKELKTPVDFNKVQEQLVRAFKELFE